MSTRRILLSLIGAAALGVGTARGQSGYWQTLDGDTALVILTGDTASVDLWLTQTGGISAYSVTVHYDEPRVTLLSADSTQFVVYGLPTPTVTFQTGSAVISASGTGSTFSSAPVARLTFAMDATALEGSLVSFTINSLVDAAGADVLTDPRTALLNVCQATRVYGDVDVNRTVNSRDALITLTAAVGIPVAGFEMQWGDVDVDGLLTSRDALFILSRGIGEFVPFGVLTGENVPGRCAPLEPTPDDLMFFRSGVLQTVAAGDTIVQAATLDPSTTTSYRTSWAPDGSRIAYTGNLFGVGFGYDIVTADPDGLNPDTLNLTTFSEWSPAWSPTGTQIAYVGAPSGQAVYLMDADGANQVQITADTFAIGAVAWSPDGSRIAFTGYSTGACCFDRLWGVNADGTGLGLIDSTATNKQFPSWSPGSDSVAVADASAARVRRFADLDPGGVLAPTLTGADTYPWWSAAGVAYRSTHKFPYDYYLLRASDGRHLRLTRGVSSTDVLFVMRPPNQVYVDVVTVSPASVTVSPDLTVDVSAAVTNSNATTNTTAFITWVMRDPVVASVTSTGAQTATVLGLQTGSTFLVATTGGWRADSILVTVP